MIGFLTVVHILIAISLCALVLVQDSKGGGALGIGGSGSNSLLGATGAQSLASKLTRYMAIFFAISCVALTYFLAHQNKSVVDQLGTPALTAPAMPAATQSTPAVPAETAPPGASSSGVPASGTDAVPKAASPATPTTSGQPEANDKK
ncbi:MAG: preprotein translocase subunit SecG [Deltaproteobacteria bacterium]|jgi:preprotein translocase subunit SecG|nr:preprotein translocase subunit SecG [Deltaproteobacteria bacterium]